jgi:uncharacterized protein (DUF58 family)
VPHRAAAEQRVEQLFPERGHVLINGFELSTRFPFGFFRRRRRLRARNVDIVVYPKPEVISDDLHLLPMYAGRMPSLRRGAGHDLFSLRDYQPQDDLRHMDWKATARSRRLTLRVFTSEDERRISIILDTRLAADSEQGSKDRFERGVIHTASLLKHFIDERAEVRLVLGEETGQFGAGTEHLYRCLRRLALVAPQIGTEEATLASAGEQLQGVMSNGVVEHDYAILLTAAVPGSIPAAVWRTSHVIYL